MTSYKCSKCDYTRNIKGYTTQHINKTKACIGAVIKEYIVKVQCEICNKEFNNENLLQTHKKSCIEKKVLVQVQYADPEKMLKNYEMLTQLIKTTIKENNEMKCQVQILIKRIDKMEKLQKDDGFVELGNDDSNCEHNYNKGLNITSREQVCEFFHINTNSCITKRVQVELNGEMKVGLLSISNISVDGCKYMFDPKDKKKGDKLACDLKIYDLECCENVAVWIKDDEHLCCENHKQFYK